MNNPLAVISGWPADKKLTLIFPSVLFLIALFTGAIFHIQPDENKVALIAGGIYLLLTLILQLPLRKGMIPSRVSYFLYEFWPVPAILLGYLTMRIFRLELSIETFGIPQQDDLMIQIDNILFGKTIPLYLQNVISPSLTFFTESAYLHFYYLMPIGTLIFFFFRKEYATYFALRKAVIFTLAGGFSLYFFLPVVGPVVFMKEEFSIPLTANHQIVTDAVNSFRFTYDCFPSLHTAIPWLTLFMTWHYFRWPARSILLFMTLSISFSTMYLRYHYGADVIAGFLWAFIVSYLVKKSGSEQTQMSFVSGR